MSATRHSNVWWWLAVPVLSLALGGCAAGDSNSAASTSTAAETENTGQPAVTATADAETETLGLLLDVMAAHPDLTMSAEAYLAHGYDLELAVCGTGCVSSVMAPSDEAFERYLSARGLTLEEFLEGDPESAHTILGSQIVYGLVSEEPGSFEMDTLNPDFALQVAVDDTGILSFPEHPEAQIEEIVEASNGAVYVVDTFLAPDLEWNADFSAGDAIEGRVTIEDEFSIPVSFTSPSQWFVAVKQDGAVILEYTDRETPFTRAVLILSGSPVGAETFDDWIATTKDITVMRREDTEVASREAVLYDLTYDGRETVDFMNANCCGGRIILRDTEHYRIWVLSQDEEDSLVVFSPVLRDDLSWYQNVQPIIDSLRMG